MRNIILFALLSMSVNLSGQYSFDKNDFFEIGIITKTLSKSDYLRKSILSDDLLSGSEGELITKEHLGFAASLKYGKGIASFAHIVFDIEFAQYRTETKSQINYRGHQFEVGDLISFETLNLSFGPRFKIIGSDGFEFSIEGGGKAFHTLNAGDDLVAGYYARAIAGINLNRRAQLNVKYGYESTLGKYSASRLPAELAFHVKIY